MNKVSPERLREIVMSAVGTSVAEAHMMACELEAARTRLEGVEAGTHVIAPRECPGEVWSEMRSQLAVHWNRIYLAPTGDEANALRDVAALDLYRIALAQSAEQGEPT